MQLLFIRKEIENKTVRDSSLLRDAVQVAVSNCLSRHKTKLWQKLAREIDEAPVPYEEIEAMQELMEADAPWTPWQTGGGGDG